MSNTPYCDIGCNGQIDEGVVLGYRYPGSSEPLRIGNHARIRSGTTIYSNTNIGHRFSCGHDVLIRAEVHLGNRVVILHKSILEGRICVGSGVKIMAHVYIPSATTIGNMVFIGPGTTFLNARYPMRYLEPVQGPVIEDHVVIGGGVTLCPNVRIGRKSFIGAGSVVTKDVPANTLAIGCPAKFQPLPDCMSKGTIPELILSGTDLWDASSDKSWQDDKELFDLLEIEDSN